MMSYLKDIKNFKYWGKGLKQAYIVGLLTSLIFILIGVGLYLWLNNTGLLLYLIFMIKYRWMTEDIR